MVMATNCYAMGKNPAIQVDNQLAKFQAEEMNAAKFESRIAKMENDLKTSASAIVGFNNKLNQISISAGRDIINDAKMIVDLNNKNMDTYKAQTKNMFELLGLVIVGLLTLILDYRKQIANHQKRLMRMIEKDEAQEEKRMTKLVDSILNKKEAV